MSVVLTLTARRGSGRARGLEGRRVGGMVGWMGPLPSGPPSVPQGVHFLLDVDPGVLMARAKALLLCSFSTPWSSIGRLWVLTPG